MALRQLFNAKLGTSVVEKMRWNEATWNNGDGGGASDGGGSGCGGGVGVNDDDAKAYLTKVYRATTTWAITN